MNGSAEQYWMKHTGQTMPAGVKPDTKVEYITACGERYTDDASDVHWSNDFILSSVGRDEIEWWRVWDGVKVPSPRWPIPWTDEDHKMHSKSIPRPWEESHDYTPWIISLIVVVVILLLAPMAFR